MYSHPLNYSPFNDGELLYLASRLDALLPEDQIAIRAELEQRGLEVPTVDRFTPFRGGVVENIEIAKVSNG